MRLLYVYIVFVFCDTVARGGLCGVECNMGVDGALVLCAGESGGVGRGQRMSRGLALLMVQYVAPMPLEVV